MGRTHIGHPSERIASTLDGALSGVLSQAQAVADRRECVEEREEDNQEAEAAEVRGRCHQSWHQKIIFSGWGKKRFFCFAAVTFCSERWFHGHAEPWMSFGIIFREIRTAPSTLKRFVKVAASPWLVWLSE